MSIVQCNAETKWRSGYNWCEPQAAQCRHKINLPKAQASLLHNLPTAYVKRVRALRTSLFMLCPWTDCEMVHSQMTTDLLMLHNWILDSGF